MPAWNKGPLPPPEPFVLDTCVSNKQHFLCSATEILEFAITTSITPRQHLIIANIAIPEQIFKFSRMINLCLNLYCVSHLEETVISFKIVC